MVIGSRNEIELLACGSRSRRSVSDPRRANAAARLMAVVVLPTPPFWLVIAIIKFSKSKSGARSQLHRQVTGVADYVGPFFFAALVLARSLFVTGNRVLRGLDNLAVNEDRTISTQRQRDRVRRP